MKELRTITVVTDYHFGTDNTEVYECSESVLREYASHLDDTCEDCGPVYGVNEYRITIPQLADIHENSIKVYDIYGGIYCYELPAKYERSTEWY